MKIYEGTYKKNNGDTRHMKFVKVSDLPDKFLQSKVKGTGKAPDLGEKELVWDLDVAGFRVFNWETADKSTLKTHVLNEAESNNWQNYFKQTLTN